MPESAHDDDRDHGPRLHRASERAGGIHHSLARKSRAAHGLFLQLVSRARASLRLGPLEFPSLAAIARRRGSCRFLNIGMPEELLQVLAILAR